MFLFVVLFVLTLYVLCTMMAVAGPKLNHSPARIDVGVAFVELLTDSACHSHWDAKCAGVHLTKFPLK